MSTATYYCSVVIRPVRMYEDPAPAEECENEVSEEGAACNQHDEPDDDYAYEEYKEAQRESRYGE